MVTPTKQGPRHAAASRGTNWLGLTVGLVVAALVLTVLWIHIEVSARVAEESAAASQTVGPRPVASASTTQDPDTEPTETPEPAIEIEPGKVTRLYIPSDDPDLNIDVSVLQMPSSCIVNIEPPIGTPDQGEVFQCGDFAMPSTDTDDNVVLAGHSGKSWETVFNRLYPQGESLVGHSVFLQTTTSDGQWLEYRVHAVYEPMKDELPYMEEVWTPTPGRLILVTCLQEDDLWASERNSIFIADFVGVQPGT